MEKILNLTIEETVDEYWGVKQEIYSKEEEIIFNVADLSDCPEDAIIGRELFDAYDYVAALKKGMELAKKGYEDINIIVEQKEKKNNWFMED